MKVIKLLVAILTTVSISGMTCSVMAAEADTAKTEKAGKETITVVGKVSVIKDEKGEITGVELTATDNAYQVKKNAESKALQKEEGKNVEAVGIVKEKNGKKILNVKSYKVMP